MRRFTFASMFGVAVLGLALSNPMSARAQDLVQAPLVPGTPIPTYAPPVVSYAPVQQVLVPQPVFVTQPVYQPIYRTGYRYPVRVYRGGFVRRGYRRW